MTDSVRNPRENPDSGDRVATATGKVRTVIERRGNEIRYRTETGIERSCWISTWQEWCRKNSVLRTSN